MKKNIYYFAAFTVIGMIALIAIIVFDIHTGTTTGIMAGFLPTGVFGLYVTLRTQNDPRFIRNMEIANDERNLYLRHKTGHSAFWITHAMVFATTMFSNSLQVTLSQFGIFMMIFMPSIYFLMRIIYGRTH